jgi:hypothetical protein
MRKLTAFATVVLFACLGLAGTGSAQTQSMQIQGTIQAADCQSGDLSLSTGSGRMDFPATGQTAVFVNGTPTQFCALQSYVGDPATVNVTPSNSEFVLGQVDVNAPQAAVQPMPASVGTSGTSSLLGIALGALIAGGLVYLATHRSSTPAYSNPAPWYAPSRWCSNNTWNQQGCP